MSGPFDQHTFAVIDVETTGLVAATERMIEVAVVKANGSGDLIETWSSLLQPNDRELVGRLVALSDAPPFSDMASRRLGTQRHSIVFGRVDR